MSTGILAGLPLPCPPEKGQEDTENHMVERRAIFDKTIESGQREIGVLGKYRTVLIHDVVTEKLDVRGMELSATDDDGLPDGIGIWEDESDEPDETREAVDVEYG